MSNEHNNQAGARRPLDENALAHAINMMPWRTDELGPQLREFAAQLWLQFCSVPAAAPAPAVPEQAATRSQLAIGRDAIEYEKWQSHKAGYKQGYQQGRADAAKAALTVPEIGYPALIRAAYAKDKKWAQGTNGCIAFARGAEWFRELMLAAAPSQEPYKDSAPHLSVGESSFESWFSAYNPANRGDKQRARDAYAAGMADPLVTAAPSQPVTLTDSTLAYIQDRLVSISSYVADQDDRAAQAILKETLRVIAALREKEQAK